jgi:hypothetical protein
MPLTLENRLRQMLIFNLPHETYCRPSGCACSDIVSVIIGENPRTGERAPRHVPKKVPDSLTFLALERRSGLPSVLLDVPDVRAAIAKGHLRVLKQEPDAPPAPAPDSTEASQEAAAVVPPKEG